MGVGVVLPERAQGRRVEKGLGQGYKAGNEEKRLNDKAKHAWGIEKSAGGIESYGTVETIDTPIGISHDLTLEIDEANNNQFNKKRCKTNGVDIDDL